MQEESETIDPQLVRGETGIYAVSVCMEGLTRPGKKPGEILPGVAKKWEVSKDEKTWTFYLRKNAFWSNGTPITAMDFYFGWKRALEPSTGSTYSAFLYLIKNAKKYNRGKIKNFSKVGLEVINDYTFKVRLDSACTYFPQLTVFPVTFPVNKTFYNKNKKKYGLSPYHMLYNGPWKMVSRIPGQGGMIKYRKNEYYWNIKNIKLDKLEFEIIKDDNTAANLFMNNQIDITRILPDIVNRFKDNPNFNDNIHYISDGAVWYIGFNTENKFFKNRKIRKAFSMAINRKILCNKIRKDGSEPAYALVPYNTIGDKNFTFRKEFSNKLFSENNKKARKLLEEGLKEIGAKHVQARLLLNSNPQNTKIALFIQEQLRKNLEVKIYLNQTTFKNRLQKMRQKNYDFVYAGWGPDYNDPMTYINLFTSWNPNNNTSWSHEKYDELVSLAADSPENRTRMKAMAEAEKIIINEMPIAPLFFSSRVYLVNNHIKDLIFGLGGKPIFYWAYCN
ncbi:MAG: peptide ABC transporter substrate-binding protein [Victivallales bacterium]|nr:peptide ABC transporter substrate-binding protein [Victivallales bacterium]